MSTESGAAQEDPIGIAGGLNAYGFANGDPVNFSDPFGLCPPCNGDDIIRDVGRLLQPAQPSLEFGGILAIAPLGGNMGMASEISAEVLSLGQAFRSAGTRLGLRFAARAEALLGEARAARDALGFEVGANKAMVIGGYNTRTGVVAACTNGGGLCAEDNVVQALGGNASEVRFTEPVRPRNFDPRPVCDRCKLKYSRDQFPPGTKGWDH